MWQRAVLILLVITAAVAAEDRTPKRIAAIVTEYRINSHADVIASRLFRTQTLDDNGARPALRLVSVFTDQVPESDVSRKYAREYDFTISNSVREALTLGTDSLAVDGVLLIAEHGRYPESDTGQTIYPKRRLFGEIAQVFRQCGRSVPVFSDKHLADNWQDAKWLYDTARELNVPLMAGSSLPTSWRRPEVDLPADAQVSEVLAVSYGSLDAYGFHALEMVQCLAERRRGGETGVKSVKTYTGKAVWEAEAAGVYDRQLLDAALSRMELRPVPVDSPWREKVPEPVLFSIEYTDGLKGSVLTLNGAVAEFASAWKLADGQTNSTLFKLGEEHPFLHFANLVEGIERLMHEKKAPWPVERTLLTSGILDAALISKRDQGRPVETRWLSFPYSCEWTWKQPPGTP